MISSSVREMNIVIVADNAYVQHAAVMLTSLFETNRDIRFRVFLLTDAVSDENRSRLERLCHAYNSEIEIHMPEVELKQMANIDINKLPSGRWNTMIYYKLFMPTVLPTDVDRCLFLDVDMVVVDDLKPLYDLKLQDNEVIAAVEDVISCLDRKKALGMRMDDYYINSGVILCDIAKWRRMEKQRQIFDFVLEWSDRIINEQDVIAVYMNQHIRLLPLRWNMVACNYIRQRYVFPKYYEELHNARKHPAIHHFCTMVQPWYADSPHPYRHLYKKYLKKYGEAIGETMNFDFPYKERPKTAYQKLRNQVGRILNLFDIIKQPGYILHKVRY